MIFLNIDSYHLIKLIGYLLLLDSFLSFKNLPSQFHSKDSICQTPISKSLLIKASVAIIFSFVFTHNPSQDHCFVTSKSQQIH